MKNILFHMSVIFLLFVMVVMNTICSIVRVDSIRKGEPWKKCVWLVFPYTPCGMKSPSGTVQQLWFKARLDFPGVR